MDDNLRYQKLLEKKRQIEKELEEERMNSGDKNEISREMIFRVFHASSYLMAINKLDTGQYVDVNEAFLNTLGYKKNEIIGHTSDDIQIFSDIEGSNKYIKLISRLNKIKDYEVTLKSKSGDEKPFLFSAETVPLNDEIYLLTTFTPLADTKNKKIKESRGSVLDEIFETVSSYLALFSIGEDKKIYLVDLNSKAKSVEFISNEEMLGKCIEDTPLINRIKLVELLNHIRITGEEYKLAASNSGDASEGFYMGFPLTSGNIVITWEPSTLQKSLDDLYNQGVVFEKFAEMLPEMIYEVDLSGNIQYANQRIVDFFGYSKDELKRGINLSDLFPDNYKSITENLNTVKSPGEASSKELIATRKDGTLVPIVAHSFAKFLNDKKIGYRGVISDISKQKEYEDQIKREKAFLENLYNSIPVAIVISNSEGIISMINREFTNLFGYSPEEAINRSINDLVVPEDLLDEAIAIDKLAVDKTNETRETIRKDKSGTRIHVSLAVSSIKIDGKDIAYLAIYRDITSERKGRLLQEILVNISNSALKQSSIKEIYPVIVSELCKIWDTNNFYIVLYDKAAHKLSLPFFVDEKDQFEDIPASGTITGWIINNPKPALLKEADMKRLEDSGEIELVGTPCKVWMGVPLKVEGEIIGVMCLQDYNSEDKFLAEDLNILEFIANQIAIALQRRMMLDNLISARQKAEEAALSKQVFMSTMSHEIRTPLNEVIGITNLLLQGKPREDQMDFIRTLKFSGNHLLTLVNDVLDYNKMESGKIVFEQTQFNLSQFLDEIMRSYSFRSKAKNLVFEINKADGLPEEVIGDQIRLNQILSNLLSNALKFTKSGSIKVSVREIERKEKQIRLEFIVADTGIGIPQDKHSVIFDSFIQASEDTTRHFGGTGLGLAICKKLIEFQGGTISVESEPEKGSTFRFILSFGITEKGSNKLSAEATENFTGLEGKKVLVAEDNKINFFVANKFLLSWGIIVTHAENGQLALDELEKENFDLILMDLHMPVMDGIEATRIIRNSDNLKIKNIPIVALTAAIMSESHDKIDDLNINDYVLKPFKPHDLFERIKKHIR
jgi:PAS domain S-box-containing protein